MKIKSTQIAGPAKIIRNAGHGLVAAAIVLLGSVPAAAQVAQQPLFLGGGNVPGNLTLVPSVEWPTITSVSSLGPYDTAETYFGYFDPNKCYEYSYSATEANRHFYPVRVTANHTCSGEWSGNFMNWAATQTIDPFRAVLTGGLRVVDTPSETWLEKARHTGQGGTNIYPNRRLPDTGNNSALVDGATPLSGNWIRMRVQGLGNKMRFRVQHDDVDTNVENYNPAVAIQNNRGYELSVRVKVCVNGLLEANCRAYSGGFKPEGLIQKNADDLRIGVFGYLNDPSHFRDGGVLRARQKFVGPVKVVPGTGEVANPNREWDTTTGVLFRNPDPADAAATSAATSVTVQDSGAINYLNKFGQMTNDVHKSKDPVSELYYTALRYLKGQPPVPEYSALPSPTNVNVTRAVDGFPVITDWSEDPIQYACQKNVILGIGDVNTHRDKNLPGGLGGTDEPGLPALVMSDSSVDVDVETAAVASFEGITINTPFSGRQNSAYMAGLAWDAHTRDIRPQPAMPGTQTVSTHWVDVLEAQTLEPPQENQYYLAAKFGGFRLPENFDPDTHSGALNLDWWHSNGDILTSFGVNASPAGQSFPRPDNYYTAGRASDMVASLTEAFAKIAAEVRSSASAVASNSTRLGTDTAVFQAAFDSSKWSGDLQAFRINADGTINPTAAWNAAADLDALSEANIVIRDVLSIAPPVPAPGGSMVSTGGIDFVWTDLASTQQDLLRSSGGGPLVSTAMGQDRVNFLRGSRLEEQPGGLLRERDSRLGDIGNSDPQFVGTQDFGYALLDQSVAFSGSGVGAAYQTYRSSAAYLNRTPMLVVGANDGMLHGFNAGLGGNGGEELFAYVPNSVIENLYELTLPAYTHRFYVDGTPRIADAYFGSAWHTVAVGTTGAGGKSVFALDVTDPGSMTSSDVLWEFSHPKMGYTIGQPALAPLPNGQFGVVVTSGYETGTTDGTIWLLDPADGSIIHSFTIPNAGDLGAPLVVDLDSDRVADRIYVGDSDGNLWRFDLVGSNTGNWQPPAALRSGTTPLPLYIARDGNGLRQAITAALTSAFNEDGLHMVYFGTGSFYRDNDNVVPANPNLDSFYGIIDRGLQIAGRADLLEQTILTEQTVNGLRVRGISANNMQAGDAGWYIDLAWLAAAGGGGPEGERVVSRALVRGDRVIFATVIPNPDPCTFGGDSWIMELSTTNGGRLDYAVFDLDDDGEFDDDDWIEITDDNGDIIRIPPSAIAPDIGIAKTPAVIEGVGTDDDEVKIVSGSSGQLIRISERGSGGQGRQSWRQLR